MTKHAIISCGNCRVDKPHRKGGSHEIGLGKQLYQGVTWWCLSCGNPSYYPDDYPHEFVEAGHD